MYWYNYLSFRALGPKEITGMLHGKSDENVIDSGESDEGKEVTKSDHDNESKEEFVNSEDGDSDSEENEKCLL